jgi:hypothetical protein
MVEVNFAARLSEDLFNFEENHVEEIAQLEVEHKLAWFIIKVQLYYHIYNQTVEQVRVFASSSSASAGNSNWQKGLQLIRFASSFWKHWPAAVRKKNRALVIALTVDKRLKNGRYKNILFDDLLINQVIPEPLTIEMSREGDVLEPSLRKADLMGDHLVHLTRLRAMYLNRKKKYQDAIDGLQKLIDKFCREYAIQVQIDRNWIASAVYFWAAEFSLYTWLYKKLRPRVVVVTDQSYTGKMAAANAMGIQVVEFQHGLMDKYYPNYSLSSVFRPLHSRMILPNHIVVFGGFHRDQLLHGFWRENEIVITGNTQINEVRTQALPPAPADARFRILLPTQGKYRFELTRTILDQLSVLDPDKFIIQIRPHPLEPQVCLEYFRSLAGGSALYSVIEDRSSIFDLIGKSDLVVGFDSTTLMEAVAVGKPAVTIGFPGCPNGIHSTLGTDVLCSAIKIISIENGALPGFLNNLPGNQVYLDTWRNDCMRWGHFLYDEHYLENSRALFNSLAKDSNHS